MYCKFNNVVETEMSQTASTHQGICFLVLWVEGGPGYSENTILKKKRRRWGTSQVPTGRVGVENFLEEMLQKLCYKR